MSGTPDVEVDELIGLFVKLGLAQDRALLESEISTFNRLFDEMQAVVEELKSRPGDQRTALLALYEHPNAQVRLKAVKNSLAVAPVEARRTLQIIAESKEYPQAGEAGMTIVNLDRGIFTPT
jgi:ParB-like chromosome segregation protein Spo0J